MVSLFSSSVMQELSTKGISATLARLVREIPEPFVQKSTVYDLYEGVFTFLKKEEYRHEYTYQSAIIQKILLGKHNLKTATLLSEFRVQNNKVDIAILNGTSTAYEIKSERDNLSKIFQQTNSYRNFFARTYVVTCEKHATELKKTINKDIGIYILNNRFQLTLDREAINDPSRISPLVVLDSLPRRESIKVLETLKLEIPNVPNTLIYKELKSIFSALDPEEVHKAMLSVLKESRSQKEASTLIDTISKNHPISAALLTKKINSESRKNIIDAMNTPLNNISRWQ